MRLHWLESFEAHHLSELYDLYKKQWWTQGRSLDEFFIMVENSDIVLACYCENDQLAGFARVLTDTIFKAVIFDVIVAAAYQRQGIGRRITDYITNHQQLSNVKSFELYCPESISHFYEKIDYQKSNSIFLEKKLDRSSFPNQE